MLASDLLRDACHVITKIILFIICFPKDVYGTSYTGCFKKSVTVSHAYSERMTTHIALT